MKKKEKYIYTSTGRNCKTLIENSYVISENVHYKYYPLDELKIYFTGCKYTIVSSIIKLFTFFLNLDNCIYINNSFMSTNLYTNDFYENFCLYDNKTDAYLQLTYDMPIVIRNILADRIHIFTAKGFVPIISRHVNILKKSNSLTKNQKKEIKHDGRMFDELLESGFVLKTNKRSGLNIDHTVVDFICDKDIGVFRQLYKMLYHQKYSKYNPDYTELWIRSFINSNNTCLLWLTYNNEIVGVVGYYIVDGVLTTPLFGYNTDLKYNLNFSLYSALSYLVYFEANRMNLIEHRSGGCNDFKKQRGATGQLEYIMVKYDNISFLKKIQWMYLYFISCVFKFIYFFINK